MHAGRRTDRESVSPRGQARPVHASPVAQPPAPGRASQRELRTREDTPGSPDENNDESTGSRSSSPLHISWPSSQQGEAALEGSVWSDANGGGSDYLAASSSEDELGSEWLSDGEGQRSPQQGEAQARANRGRQAWTRDENEAPGHGRAANSCKKTKASILIASENVRGRGAQNMRGSIKWRKISTDMIRERIGLMAIQETHLSLEHAGEIADLYPNLLLLNSPDPDNPTGAGGVALVFNRLLTNHKTVEFETLVEGRAIAARFEWHQGKKLTVLAVYASTERVENHNMWEEIRSKLSSRSWKLGNPGIVLGDFNFVEDDIDRFPAGITRMDKPPSFTNLKRQLGVRDGWRAANPAQTDWTWRDAARKHMSRIDRIYLSDRLLPYSADWALTISGITRNDHSRVQVRLYALDGPETGKGRWAMQARLARDEAFLETVNKLVMAAEGSMKAVQGPARSGEANAQKIWRSLKDAVREEARERTTQMNCRRATRTKQLREARAVAVAKLAAAQQADRATAASELRAVEERLYREKELNFGRTFRLRSARTWAEAETMSKSWFAWVKERKKSEEIPFLLDRAAGAARPITGAKAMAEAARMYHEGVQDADLGVDPLERAGAIAEALDSVSARLNDEERDELGAPVTREAVREAIREAKYEKAAGVDGITHELWKALAARRDDERGTERKWADIAGVMAQVFLDVEEYGVADGTGFTDGWMCPLYKKGDRSDIANYRPITLLNTDYKLYTKTLATKLARVAPHLVHESQAGFVKGRSITDHVKISLLMLDYAEAVEEDGMIVALDQEKAYDRVRHDYLIQVLDNLRFPQRLIRTVRSLYQGAFTSVMVNGHLSRGYRVTRGVRQGDPLSCLLFNLAIEPLSALLRKSTLKGYSVEGVAEKLIATLLLSSESLLPPNPGSPRS